MNCPDASRSLTRRAMLGRSAAGLAAGGFAASWLRDAAAQDATSAPAAISDERMSQALTRLDALARQNLTTTGVPGMAIGVVHQDRLVFVKGYGVPVAGEPEPVDADTLFRLASLSKPMAAAVVAALVSDGAVGWDDRIAAIDPEIAFHDPWVTREATVRDLLCHRSGLPASIGDALVDLGFDRTTILHKLRFILPGSSFRSQWVYNNVGFATGAIAAARAAGLSWEDACVERLYKPLGMNATTNRYAEFVAAPNHAAEHVQVDGKWAPSTSGTSLDAIAPAGAVNSSINDLAKWMRLELGLGAFNGSRLIAAEALGETRRPQIVYARPDDPNVSPGFYGLGWEVNYVDAGRTQLSGPGGLGSGAATAVYLWPESSLGIAVLSNSFPIGLVEAMAVSFHDLAVHGALTRDWLAVYRQQMAAAVRQIAAAASPHDYAKPPAASQPALPDVAYLGAYANDLYGRIDIVAQGGNLAIAMGPKPKTFPLTHYDRDIFTFQPVGESNGAFALSGVTFTIGPDGRATNVLVDYLDVSGQGDFRRLPAGA